MFRRADRYGDYLNSFDALKLIALFTMVIDHIGYYLLPGNFWMRAIGRMAFPLFLFLVGYSGSWKRQSQLWLWGGLVTFVSAVTNHSLLPFDILIAIAVTRWMLSFMTARWPELTPGRLVRIVIAAILWFPLFYWFEYSTVAFLFGICGYLQKQRPKAISTIAFLYATMSLHLLWESIVFGNFTMAQWLLMLAVLAIDLLLMRSFSLRRFDTGFLPALLRRGLQWAARNTLPIYGLHVMGLMIYERIFMPEWNPHFQWFSF